MTCEGGRETAGEWTPPAPLNAQGGASDGDGHVTIRRTLAAARPDAFLPNLATSVNNLALRLGELGRREEALTASEEATDIRRRLGNGNGGGAA